MIEITNFGNNRIESIGIIDVFVWKYSHNLADRTLTSILTIALYLLIDRLLINANIACQMSLRDIR